MMLETERLRLRPMVEADSERLFPIMSDAEVMAHWDIPEIDDPDLLCRIVQSQVATMAEGKAVYWAIETLAEGAFIGVCDLSEIDLWHKRAEIGLILARQVWGQGYASETVAAVAIQAAAMGLRRLQARTQLGNRRSEAVLERLGFKPEGLLRGHILREGQRRDCRLFGLLL